MLIFSELLSPFRIFFLNLIGPPLVSWNGIIVEFIDAGKSWRIVNSHYYK